MVFDFSAYMVGFGASTSELFINTSGREIGLLEERRGCHGRCRTLWTRFNREIQRKMCSQRNPVQRG